MNDDFNGIIRVQDYASFHATAPNTDVEKAFEELLVLIQAPMKSSPTSDWPKVKAIRRVSEYVMVVDSPGLRAELRFNPAIRGSGDYSIFAPYSETGNVQEAKVLSDEEVCRKQYSMLKSFAHRFVVTTNAVNRERTTKVWLIGLTSVRDVNPHDLE